VYIISYIKHSNTNTTTKLQHSRTAAHREHFYLDHVRPFLHLMTRAIPDQLAAQILRMTITSTHLTVNFKLFPASLHKQSELLDF